MNEQQRAIHEIGHVLAGVAFGWQIDGVGIDNGAMGLGAALVHVPCEDTLLAADPQHEQQLVRERYEQRLIQLAAGAAAEEMLLGFSRGEGSPSECESDWGKFVHLKSRWEASAHASLKLRFGNGAPFTAAKEEAQVLFRDWRLYALGATLG